MRYAEIDRIAMSHRNKIIPAFFLPGVLLLALGAIDAFSATWKDLETGGTVMILEGILVVWGPTSMPQNRSGAKRVEGV